MDLGKLEELTASLRKKGHPEYYILKMRNAFFRKQMDTLEGQKRYWDIWKQVRPKQISTWHYSTLGIPNDSSDEKVNKTFRALSKIYHPDNQETWDADKFIEITNAKDVILKQK